MVIRPVAPSPYNGENITETESKLSYLDVDLCITTAVLDKRDNLNFCIVNFLYLDDNHYPEFHLGGGGGGEGGIC